MKITLSDKLIAYMALISGLSISAVAVYYSVAGLVSIFAAAAVPIMVMGVALEVSKLVATVWLKQNWKIAPVLIRTYLMIAVVILMMITSMGIFGYLSKAHLDQAVPTGDVADKVALIDEKIKTQKDNVDASKKALAQMDAQVNEILSRTNDAKGTERAVQIRRNQAKEREALQKDIARAQGEIAKLNDERAPIAKELRKVEAEVGPIKYIAALLYGDNPDQNLLEKAVRAVIILIVVIFDPLAVVLLLASQYSFAWFRKNEEEQGVDSSPEKKPVEEPEPETHPWPFKVQEDTKEVEEPMAMEEEPVEEPKVVGWKLGMKAPIEQEEFQEEKEDSAINQWNKMIEAAEKEVAKEQVSKVELDDEDDDPSEPEEVRIAKTNWKAEHPDDTIKHQRFLFESGAIDSLPWMKEPYLKDEARFKLFPDLENQLKSAMDERPGDYLTNVEVERAKPDLTEVIEPPKPGIRLSDLKKKDPLNPDLTVLDKVGREQITRKL